MLFLTLCRTKQHLSKFHLGAFLCGLAVAGAACIFYAGDFNHGRNADSISIADPVNIVIVENSTKETISVKNESGEDSDSWIMWVIILLMWLFVLTGIAQGLDAAMELMKIFAFIAIMTGVCIGLPHLMS